MIDIEFREKSRGWNVLHLWRITPDAYAAEDEKLQCTTIQPEQIDHDAPTLIIFPGRSVYSDSGLLEIVSRRYLEMLGGTELADYHPYRQQLAQTMPRIQTLAITYPYSTKEDRQTLNEATQNVEGEPGNPYSLLAYQLLDVFLSGAERYDPDSRTQIPAIQKQLRTKVIGAHSRGSLVAEGLQNAMFAILTEKGFPQEVITGAIMPNLKIVTYGDIGIGGYLGDYPVGNRIIRGTRSM